MPQVSQKITPCLWFDDQAEEAARFYTAIFPDSEILHVARYGKEGFEIHGRPEGSAMTVGFRIAGQEFVGLNGGPHFKFSEAVSFHITCDDQPEVDHYWDKLSAGGDPNTQQCGWLKDRFGLSWQVVPRVLTEMLRDPDPAKSQPVMKAMLQMKKLDIATLERAYGG